MISSIPEYHVYVNFYIPLAVVATLLMALAPRVALWSRKGCLGSSKKPSRTELEDKSCHIWEDHFLRRSAKMISSAKQILIKLISKLNGCAASF